MLIIIDYYVKTNSPHRYGRSKQPLTLNLETIEGFRFSEDYDNPLYIQSKNENVEVECLVDYGVIYTVSGAKWLVDKEQLTQILDNYW